MNVNQFILNVTSEDPDRIAAFHADIVGLPKNPEIGERAFTAGGSYRLALPAPNHYFAYFSGSAINLLWQASEQKK